MEEYLRRFESEKSIAAEAELEREDLPPVQRLLGVFAPVGGDTALIRGCPFHNAVIEGVVGLPEVTRLAQRHKQAFRDRLAATAAEAGAAHPETLAGQLAVLFEGANALAASCNDPQAFTDARRAAEMLLDIALGAASGD
ncbi:hypothetical protein [Streptomyces sp. NPDC058157]|uniref:hypothetical protein n=1 Tax=Streptomyces sp. NPDC058157 TaxID=3346360 RepID=UPI0036EAD28C